MDKRYQVFVSSTFADLQEERSKVIQTIMELDCIPAGMELFPAIDEEQFQFIKRIIDDCDYYILIIGGRYGTLSDDGISYTEKEYDYAIQQGIKVMAFVHSNPDAIPLGKSEKEKAARDKLDAFRKKVSINRLIKFWTIAEELPGLVALSLSKTIKTYPAVGWVRSNMTADPQLYKEMNELRKKNQELTGLLSQQSITQVIDRENIADLDDLIQVGGSVTTFHDGRTLWETKLTWSKIFSLISPYLLERPTDKIMQEKVAKTIYSTSKNHYKNDYKAVLNDQDFQTIKIHLNALGLINLAYDATGNGGKALFWELTELGEKLLLKLRSVKKQG